ncbi:hypothetical protein Poli38472_003013 [Pythium oligandrum]|uniref:Glycosyl hydrolase n=1 Tax=Pythium oligandrum TaxID=41045 RepID=A0A8K1FFR8_PYTOL|nr:hypothetical protein Poli38472_003013 [Pythium oligandrum]|eukprot:TMW57088.1 hypothetical protein Poli38472_003013 [Pythium oligandrum]
MSARSTTSTMSHDQLHATFDIRHGHFVDAQGRVHIFRGVNLGGSSKLPHGYTHSDPLQRARFFDDVASVSFVNRPFPLAEADEHFSRLRRWGLTFVRFIVTWEAIEHAGPGIYDREYLQYIRAVLEKAAEYDILFYIDPHQDVWSRWTGGDGAPMWTLESIGLEPRNFEATKSALCIETANISSVDKFPKMIWPTNYFKYACATMFTLFYAGGRFAPSCYVNGVQVQEFLQSHYINAMTELARVLVGLPNIVGFGSMNEPSCGLIGVEDLSQCFQKTELRYELAPSPFQGMCLAEGIPQTVGSWSNGIKQHVFGRPDKMVRVDPQGKRAYKDGHRCVWLQEGVWSMDAQGNATLHKPNYFSAVNFDRDFYVPFARRYIEQIRSVLPATMLFVELPPLEFYRSEFPDLPPSVIPRAINATHWYDGVTLFLQQWRPYFTVDPTTKMPAFGRHAVRKMHERQLAHIKKYGTVQMHNAPTIIGETGIPFNMNHGKAYRSGDYRDTEDALDHTITCLEANLLSYTLWCYASDNTHSFGDMWNREDLSIVSEDRVQQRRTHERDEQARCGLLTPHNRYDGAHNEPRDAAARALLAFARPHATKIAGIPSKSSFFLLRRRYEAVYTALDGKSSKDRITGPTEIYVPHCQYPRGYAVHVSDGRFETQTHDGWDTVLVYHDENVKNRHVLITSDDPEIEKQWRKHVFQQVVLAGLAVAGLIAILYAVTH